MICITLSSGLSATYQSALAAAEAAGGRIPVRVVDSRSVTMGQGLLCLAAAELASGGADLDAVEARVVDLIARTKAMGVLGTLDHLQRGGGSGGRRPGGLAPLGQAGDPGPRRGGRQESKQRTRARALDYLVTKCRADAPFERIGVASGAADDLDAITARLTDVETTHPLLVVDLGPVVGTHAGPGTVGVAYLIDPRP